MSNPAQDTLDKWKARLEELTAERGRECDFSIKNIKAEQEYLVEEFLVDLYTIIYNYRLTEYS